MIHDSELDERLRQLGESLTPTASMADGVMRQIDQAPEAPIRLAGADRALSWVRHRAPRIIGIAAAAAVLLVAAGLILSFLGLGDGEGEWWLGPPAAWAEEVHAALGQARIKGVTCRERVIWQSADGTRHVSSTVLKVYLCRGSHRNDIYDGKRLREVQWYVPGRDGQVMIGYRLDSRSWGCWPSGGLRKADPIEKMRSLVKQLGRADRLLGTPTIEGRMCVGFEINASKLGSNPATHVARIWFDVKTKMPVRTEWSFPSSRDARRRTILSMDRFNYGAALRPDTFIPKIPAGYVQAHTDALRPGGDGARLNDEQVRKRLARKVERADFRRLALKEAVQAVSDLARVEIYVNWPVLDKLGIRPSTKVNVDLRDVSLGRALGAILADVDETGQIGYAVRNGIVAVSRITRRKTVFPPRSEALQAAAYIEAADLPGPQPASRFLPKGAPSE